MTAGCRVVMAGWMLLLCQNPDTDLQMHIVTQGPLTLLARAPAWPSGASSAGASHSSHPPTCLQDTSLCWGLQSSCSTNSDFSAAQDWGHGKLSNMLCLFRITSQTWWGASWVGLWRTISSIQNKWCEQIITFDVFDKDCCAFGGKHNWHLVTLSSLFSANSWRGIDVS